MPEFVKVLAFLGVIYGSLAAVVLLIFWLGWEWYFGLAMAFFWIAGIPSALVAAAIYDRREKQQLRAKFEKAGWALPHWAERRKGEDRLDSILTVLMWLCGVSAWVIALLESAFWGAIPISFLFGVWYWRQRRRWRAGDENAFNVHARN